MYMYETILSIHFPPLSTLSFDIMAWYIVMYLQEFAADIISIKKCFLLAWNLKAQKNVVVVMWVGA